MSGMYGMEVLAKLREMDADARVIVATADIQSSTKILAEEQGAVGFINKPFEPAAVLDTVNSALKVR
jgi:two-component system chemotaxis response regulator CheY